VIGLSQIVPLPLFGCWIGANPPQQTTSGISRFHVWINTVGKLMVPGLFAVFRQIVSIERFVVRGIIFAPDGIAHPGSRQKITLVGTVQKHLSGVDRTI